MTHRTIQPCVRGHFTSSSTLEGQGGWVTVQGPPVTAGDMPREVPETRGPRLSPGLPVNHRARSMCGWALGSSGCAVPPRLRKSRKSGAGTTLSLVCARPLDGARGAPCEGQQMGPDGFLSHHRALGTLGSSTQPRRLSSHGRDPGP